MTQSIKKPEDRVWDKASVEALVKAERDGVNTCFTRLDAQPGPCRFGTEGLCGADTIVARNFLREVAGGTAKGDRCPGPGRSLPLGIHAPGRAPCNARPRARQAADPLTESGRGPSGHRPDGRRGTPPNPHGGRSRLPEHHPTRFPDGPGRQLGRVAHCHPGVGHPLRNAVSRP